MNQMDVNISIELDAVTATSFQEAALALEISVSEYVRGIIDRHFIQLAQEKLRIPREEFRRVLEETMSENAELYRRLAMGSRLPEVET
jgi:hypothetical protein